MSDLQGSIETVGAIIALSAALFVIAVLAGVLMLFRMSRVIEIGLKLTKADLQRREGAE